jgi:excisionase family DNA binding protein
MSGYSLQQAADRLGISYWTLWRRCNEGLIPHLKFGPKTTRIPRNAMLELEQHGLSRSALRQRRT